MSIFHASSDFDLSKVHLGAPTATASGSYFTKINHTVADHSLYMYTPKGANKNGVVTAGNRKYIDLVFTAANSNFVEWVQEFETRIQELIYEKRNTWFTEELERDDIESVFVPVIKAIKGGQYILRAYLQPSKARTAVALPPVFDDHETPRTIDCIQPTSELITILDFQGVKFTAKSFVVVVVIKQIMVMENSAPTFQQCLIKPAKSKIIEVNTEDLNVQEDKE
jgi:hypothetical protein